MKTVSPFRNATIICTESSAKSWRNSLVEAVMSVFTLAEYMHIQQTGRMSKGEMISRIKEEYVRLRCVAHM